jgi:ribosome-associated toxin RatA of RatAB toxin-antitoxin module
MHSHSAKVRSVDPQDRAPPPVDLHVLSLSNETVIAEAHIQYSHLEEWFGS